MNSKLSILTILLLTLSMFSCTTLNKAIQKVAGETDFTTAQKGLLAVKCSAMFPPVEYISEGTTTVDSSAFKEAYKAIERQLQDAGDYMQSLIDIIDRNDKDNNDLKEMLVDAQRKVDSLKGVKSAYKVIPCPESHTRDTGYMQATARLTALQIAYDALSRENAAKDLKIDKANADKDQADQKAKEADKKRWNLFWVGMGIGAGVVVVGGFILKLKSII